MDTTREYETGTNTAIMIAKKKDGSTRVVLHKNIHLEAVTERNNDIEGIEGVVGKKRRTK